MKLVMDPLTVIAFDAALNSEFLVRKAGTCRLCSPLMCAMIIAVDGAALINVLRPLHL